MMTFLHNLLDLSLEAAPWLVVGLALGGLMQALIPTEFLQRHLRGTGFGSITKATLLGAPLPLCSCGVIPAALGLRKAGASKPATTAFLVSTPETGIDSISVTYALMGPFMAVVRPLAALCSALVAGSLVALFDREESIPEAIQDAKITASCCNTKPTPGPDCCSTTSGQDQADNSSSSSSSQTLLQKAWSGIHYAFTGLLDDILFWLAIGMLFAAASKTFLPADFLAQWGQGLTAMLVMLLAGIPMYICATASTPVAAGLMLAGVSPGVALVLLLTGPATNISTLGIIHGELGKRSMWLYLLGVSVTAITFGLLVDVAINHYQINISAQLHADHGGLAGWMQWTALIGLVTIALRKLPYPGRSTLSRWT